MKKTRYIANRIKIVIIVQLIIIAVLVAMMSIEGYAGGHISLGVIIAVIVLLLDIVLIYRVLYKPYEETLKVYEQFISEQNIRDLLGARYPMNAETERAITKLADMIDKDKLLSVSKKQAEYLALQNQINPHFLYNTLEGIRSEALIAGLDSIAEMTEALATFFRYTISHVDHLVTLEDELANIENYYYIQKFRFGDKLKLSIVYDHDDSMSELDILGCCLPKLTLQPIVENSIYHGIERKIGEGHLTIRVGVSDQRLAIRVSDDGLGMDDEKVREINHKLRLLSVDDMSSDSESKGGIAIVNVNSRIKLLFGDEYGIVVYSHEGSGTDVDISLPIVSK